MKKNISLVIFVMLLFSVMFFQQASASCIIQGYGLNVGTTMIGAHFEGYCENANDLLILDLDAGEGYGFAWGGPGDNCDSMCGNVYVNATNTTDNLIGYSEYYPMNSSNMVGWSSIGAHNVNITLLEQDNPLASFGTNPIDTYTGGSTIVFDGKCSDNIEVDYIKIYGNWSSGWSAKSTNSSPYNDTWWNTTISSIPQGTWKWSVWCNDTSGNEDFENTNRTFTVDTGAPTITIVSPSTGETKSLSIWFNVTTSENVDACNYSLDSGTNISLDGSLQTWNKINSSMTKGSHSVIFYCNDSVNNLGIASRSFTVDNTAPVITIVSPTNTTYAVDDQWFNVTTDETALSCNYSYDGAANASLSGSGTSFYVMKSNMDNGIHSVQYYCSDQVSNLGQTSIRYFTIDDISPTASFGTYPIDEYSSIVQSVLFQLSCSDDFRVTSLKLYTNISGTWAATATNSSPYNDTVWNSTQTVANGYYLWAVYCEDQAGNFDYTDTNRTLTVNYQPPTGGGGGGSPSIEYPICDKIKEFLQPYGFLPLYSALDVTNLFSTLKEDGCPYSEEEVNSYVKDYESKCGPADTCSIFGWLFIGDILRPAGIYLEEKVGVFDSCEWAYVLFILIILIIAITIYVIYKKKKKKRIRR